MDETIRHDWSLEEVRAIHDAPLSDLIFRAQQAHRRFHDPNEVQLCSLLSIKTGGCQEDCGYCAQSAHHDAGVERQPLMEIDEVVAAAHKAKEAGASRFCMGAAWRHVRDGKEFDRVCEIIRTVNDLRLETCVTLGMVNEAQAQRLKAAGLTAYNHNIDTSRDYYPNVVTTRTFEERLETLRNIRGAGISICSGGIIGMGESIEDRCSMLIELANLPAHPENVPINALVAVQGTPMAGHEPVTPFEFVRMIATARILMPASIVRLSAGRAALDESAQMLCFVAGANSIFYGEKLLTTGNPDVERDLELLRKAGIRPLLPASVREAETAA